MLADFGETAEFLSAHKTKLSPNASVLFLDYIADDLAAAMKLFIRRAEGDLSDDTYPKKFPTFAVDTGVTVKQLFQQWVVARKPRASSVDRWRGVFLELQKRFPNAAAAILPTEAQDWLDGLISEERSGGKTVRDIWLTAAKTVFNWAVSKKLLSKIRSLD